MKMDITDVFTKEELKIMSENHYHSDVTKVTSSVDASWGYDTRYEIYIGKDKVYFNIFNGEVTLPSELDSVSSTGVSLKTIVIIDNHADDIWKKYFREHTRQQEENVRQMEEWLKDNPEKRGV